MINSAFFHKPAVWAILISLFSCASIGYCEKVALPLIETNNEKELLFLRRMADYWEEDQLPLVKAEIIRYFEKAKKHNAPKTYFHEYLQALLGNIYLSEKNYEKALSAYDTLEIEAIRNEIRPNLLQCLYQTKNYAQLSIQCQNYLQLMPQDDSPECHQAYFLLAESYYNLFLQAEDAEKETYARQAKEHFKLLISTNYENYALQCFSDIEQLSGHYMVSADYLLQLAEKLPGQREAFYFKAASLQAKENEEAAGATFLSIWKMHGESAKEALFNYILISFKLGQYEKVIAEQDEIMQSSAEEQLPFVHFFAGKSFFTLKDYFKAADALGLFCKMENKNSPEMEMALINLMECAFETDNPSLFEEALGYLSQLFSEKTELLKNGWFELGLLHKNKERFEAAEKAFAFVSGFDEFEDRENLLFEHALAIYKNNKWYEARFRFEDFIREFPESGKLGLAWQYLINASIKELELAESTDKPEKTHILINTLEAFLSHDSLPTDEARKQYGFLMGQYAFQLGNFKKALKHLIRLNQTFPDHSEIVQSNILIGFAYLHEAEDLTLFACHIEKALELRPDHEDSRELHFSLFNAYLELAARSDANRPSLEDCAAEHLYCAWQQKINIIDANLHWLSNYYFNRFLQDKDNTKYALRAKELTVAVINHTALAAGEAEGGLAIEEQYLKLNQIALLQNNNEERIAALEALAAYYQSFETTTWRYQDKTLFELALCHRESGDKKRALELFEELIKIKPESAYYYHASQLYATRLILQGLSKQDFSYKNPVIIKAINTLKNITIKRRVETEPFHLEAALDYIHLQCLMEKPGSRGQKYLGLLKKIKLFFKSTEDIIGKEYTARRKENPEKNRLYKEYLQFIKTEIKAYQYLHCTDKDETKALDLKNQAVAEYFACIDNAQTTDYLKNKAKKSLQLLNNNETVSN